MIKASNRTIIFENGGFELSYNSSSEYHYLALEKNNNFAFTLKDLISLQALLNEAIAEIEIKNK